MSWQTNQWRIGRQRADQLVWVRHHLMREHVLLAHDPVAMQQVEVESTELLAQQTVVAVVRAERHGGGERDQARVHVGPVQVLHCGRRRSTQNHTMSYSITTRSSPEHNGSERTIVTKRVKLALEALAVVVDELLRLREDPRQHRRLLEANARLQVAVFFRDASEQL